ncbi:hypothetical protein EVAR_19226_1 [Eumeta japonica]|uniref:Uncharacterized protein n=1 Tax=Eumeta variegata TaxID=151549 RepID=A0A4C1VFN1_EUMVA|nr:hypothetical protein EVAR_19226_1 [Eumeta japonica]
MFETAAPASLIPAEPSTSADCRGRVGGSVFFFEFTCASIRFALKGSYSRPILGCRVQSCGFSSYQFLNVCGQAPAI